MKYLVDYLNSISFFKPCFIKKARHQNAGLFFVKTPDINQFDKPLMS